MVQYVEYTAGKGTYPMEIFVQTNRYFFETNVAWSAPKPPLSPPHPSALSP